ncbi:hypothetical protein GS636_06690 [Ruegeria sp. HKCCD4884]|uniref:hypothetical protein n=1 Tax=Ruegeria sp. HKCCD4884 TaxID=2683022 RepID=UPI0014909F14|nr:hypothetical protein [Ruegeria sp. HKCCD4884]NOD92468.1 hypothetical protein [Ruegeria sp. HKCCD4884]
MEPQEFLHRLFDPRRYPVAPTESVCIGQQRSDGKFVAIPWPYRKVRGKYTHYGVSLFEWNTPATARDFRRRLNRWTGTAVIGLDDVGEVKHGKLIKEPPVKPTAIIETKPGSQQWIYALTEICRDATLVETIMESAAQGGITDTGVKDRTRILRLPGSIKPGKDTKARLVWADWDRRFNASVLVEKGFQVPVVERHASPTFTPTHAGPVAVAPNGDPMLEWLVANNMVLGNPVTAGWVPILCPWYEEHTNAAQGGTYYHPPTSADETRAFNCYHDACKRRDRRSGAFRDHLRDMGAPVVPVLGDALAANTGKKRTLSAQAMARIFGDG